jgi:hypothetical protein
MLAAPGYLFISTLQQSLASTLSPALSVHNNAVSSPSVNVAEGNLSIPLSSKRFATVRTYKGKVLVDIREFYDMDGKLAPGHKGISLTPQQWATLQVSCLGLPSDIRHPLQLPALHLCICLAVLRPSSLLCPLLQACMEDLESAVATQDTAFFVDLGGSKRAAPSQYSGNWLYNLRGEFFTWCLPCNRM